MSLQQHRPPWQRIAILLVLVLSAIRLDLIQNDVQRSGAAGNSVQPANPASAQILDGTEWLRGGSATTDPADIHVPLGMMARSDSLVQDYPSVSPPTESKIRLVFDPEVSIEDQELITEAMYLAEGVFATKLEAHFGASVTVTVLPIVCPRHEERIALTIADSMVIYTQSPGWLESAPAERVRTVLHESTHLYQHTRTQAAPTASAAWFEEGMAEYISLMSVSELGLMDRDAVEGLFGEIAHHSDLPPLEELEAYSAFQMQPGQIYPLAYFGVALAIGNLPLSSVSHYYDAVQLGQSFPEAFQSAFGQTASRFYQEFAEFRAHHLPTMNEFPPELSVTEGVDQVSEVIVKDAPEIAIPGQQVLVIATARPGTNCTLDLIDAEQRTSIDDRDTFANGAGQVFWLVTIPGKTAAGVGMFVISCGADPTAISFPIVPAKDSATFLLNVLAFEGRKTSTTGSQWSTP